MSPRPDRHQHEVREALLRADRRRSPRSRGRASTRVAALVPARHRRAQVRAARATPSSGGSARVARRLARASRHVRRRRDGWDCRSRGRRRSSPARRARAFRSIHDREHMHGGKPRSSLSNFAIRGLGGRGGRAPYRRGKELRTSGPLSTRRSSSARASSPSSANSDRLEVAATGQCRSVGRQILAERETVDARAAQIARGRDILARLAQAEHEPRLGETGRRRLHARAARARRSLARADPHLAVQPRHRLEVVVVDLGPGVRDPVDAVAVAAEVGSEDLDRRLRCVRAAARRSSRANCVEPWSGRSSRFTLVRHHVVVARARALPQHLLGLIGDRQAGRARSRHDRSDKRACTRRRARMNVTVPRRSTRKVRAARFLAYRVESAPAQHPLHLEHGGTRPGGALAVLRQATHAGRGKIAEVRALYSGIGHGSARIFEWGRGCHTPAIAAVAGGRRAARCRAGGVGSSDAPKGPALKRSLARRPRPQLRFAGRRSPWLVGSGGG